jgi:L-alanine-DL-glutamate epimerase-like enolase superfamily enzyme
VSGPLEHPIRHPFLGSRTKFSSLLVQVHTADGYTGFGYASIESLRLVAALNQIIRDLEASLRGLDALRHEFVWERMYNLTVDILHDGAANLAMTAIDTALWDILGKRSGMPVWKLVGGFRDKVPAYASWTLWRHMTNGQLESEAAEVVRQGFHAMKLRLGGGRSFREDMERARLVRDTVGPDVAIMVDALWGMTATEGVRMARGLGELDYAWFEEPVREGDFAGMARVRDVQALPIAGGERISHLRAGKRLGAWIEYMPWWNMLFVDPPLPIDGMLQLSGAPGLGLELDEQAVAKFAAAP